MVILVQSDWCLFRKISPKNHLPQVKGKPLFHLKPGAHTHCIVIDEKTRKLKMSHVALFDKYQPQNAA